MPLVNIQGQTFGMLQVLEYVAVRGGHAVWLCVCTCGNRVIRRGTHLRRGLAVHCGCQGYRRDATAHVKARAKVPAKVRRAIARMGAAALASGRTAPPADPS